MKERTETFRKSVQKLKKKHLALMADSLPSNPGENRRTEKRRMERKCKDIKSGFVYLVHSLHTIVAKQYIPSSFVVACSTGP